MKIGGNSNKIKRAMKCDFSGGGKIGSEDDLISYSRLVFPFIQPSRNWAEFQPFLIKGGWRTLLV